MAGLEENALEPQNYTETMQLISDIENSVDKWAFDFPCDIVSSKITVSNVLKAVGLELRQEYSGVNALGEKLLDYMELVREFDRDKLFVLVGLRSYLPDDAAERFLNSVLAHEFHVMLIDSRDHSPAVGRATAYGGRRFMRILIDNLCPLIDNEYRLTQSPCGCTLLPHRNRRPVVLDIDPRFEV